MRRIRVPAALVKGFLAFLLPLTLPAFQQAQTASLEGMALDSVTGAPVGGVRIVIEIRDRGPEYHTLTDSDGRFAFHGAAPGMYNLAASKNGYVGGVGFGLYGEDNGEPIPLAPGERRAGLELRMIPAAVIAGRVSNNQGEPAPGIVMYAARISYEGRRRKMTAAEYSLLATDDRGDYRVYGLPPGRYFVAAVELKDFVNFGGSGVDAVDAAAAPPKEHLGLQYYPGVADPAQATALELRAGEEKLGVDFRYDYTPLVSVRGRVAVPAFCPGNLTFQAEREIATDQKYPIQFTSAPDGGFELRGISPGSWRIRASTTGQKTSGPCSTETASVQVGASGADGVALALQPRVKLAGVVRMEAEPDVRFKDAHLHFESFEDGGGASAQIKADGRFTETLEPRRWSLAVTGAPGDAFLKSARLGGTDVLESGLDLTAGPPAGELEIVLSAAGAQVEGAVVDASERPARGATVVLAPEPRLRVHGRLFHEATVDKDGRFAFHGIAPGEYKLFAWNELEGEAYRDPDFLRGYEGCGQKIVVRENQTIQARPMPIVK
jgi:hypothetical protein